jgi:thymidylate kinase
MSHDDVLFDRLHVSEYAYSTSIRHTNEIEAFRNFRMIDTALSKCNVKMILLTCDYDTMCKRLQEKNSIYSKDDYDVLTVMFSKALYATLIPSIVIDTSKFNKSQVVSKSLDFIKGLS